MANLMQKFTNTDIEILKSLHTLLDKYLEHILVKCEQNRMVPNVESFEFFSEK